MKQQLSFWARRTGALFLLSTLAGAAATGCSAGDALADDTEIAQLEEPLARDANVEDLATEGTVTAPSVAEVRQLSVAKQVASWPVRVDTTGTLVVALTVKECTWLGGSVVYWSSCGGTLMKCVGASGREMCIDKIA
jgi:hypothetical protein